MSVRGCRMSEDNCVLLVRRNVRPGHPHAIWNQLFAEARKLLREGIKPEVLAEALQMWDNKPGIGPAVLPHLVSDVIRMHENRQAMDDKLEKLRDWESKLEEELTAD